MKDKNQLILNQIAIWRPKLFDELTVRETAPGRLAVEDGTPIRTAKKTYRYAKNYQYKDTRYCLFFITYDDDADKAEKFLDSVKVTAKDLKDLNSFSYLKVNYKEDK